MNIQDLEVLLKQIKDGSLSIDQGVSQLRSGPFKTTQLQEACLDHHRELRQGLQEVIYGESKSVQQICTIINNFLPYKKTVLTTRLSKEKIQVLQNEFPGHRVNETAGTFTIYPPKIKNRTESEPFIGIVAAGTSDVSVLEEAAEVCIAMDTSFEKICDVGVTGIHRLFNRIEDLQSASALIVIAGMEGALPSVVAGLVGCPVFAVPTSVGYGASFNGIAALLAMLNSCAPGVSVVNIDNGFSAAFAACQVVRVIQRNRNK